MLRIVIVAASLALLGAAVNASWRGVGAVSSDAVRSVRSGSAGGVGYVRVK